MIIELKNPRACGPDDPEGMIVVAQRGVLITKKIVDGKAVPFQEDAPDDVESALAAKLEFLRSAGFVEVDA